MDGLRELIFSQGLSADLCRLAPYLAYILLLSPLYLPYVSPVSPLAPNPNPTCSYDGRTAMHCAAAGTLPDA